VQRLNTEMNEILKAPETREALARQGLTPVVDRPERLGQLVDSELARWKHVVEQAKIQAD
jgi:tripartite-type tricarboxylate transporter receptor subunit TctC